MLKEHASGDPNITNRLILRSKFDMFAPEKAIRPLDYSPGYFFQLFLGCMLATNVDSDVLLHARRQVLRPLQYLSSDVAHESVLVGIDVIILHLERCTAFVGRYPVGTDRTSRPPTYLLAVLERDLRDKVRLFRFCIVKLALPRTRTLSRRNQRHRRSGGRWLVALDPPRRAVVVPARVLAGRTGHFTAAQNAGRALASDGVVYRFSDNHGPDRGRREVQQEGTAKAGATTFCIVGTGPSRSQMLVCGCPFIGSTVRVTRSPSKVVVITPSVLPEASRMVSTCDQWPSAG